MGSTTAMNISNKLPQKRNQVMKSNLAFRTSLNPFLVGLWLIFPFPCWFLFWFFFQGMAPPLVNSLETVTFLSNVAVCSLVIDYKNGSQFFPMLCAFQVCLYSPSHTDFWLDLLSRFGWWDFSKHDVHRDLEFACFFAAFGNLCEGAPSGWWETHGLGLRVPWLPVPSQVNEVMQNYSGTCRPITWTQT